MFQLTHPRGVRRAFVGDFNLVSEVSTHAPARGATQGGGMKLFGFISFNSRTREGCDTCGRYTPKMQLVFQLTHPRGVRLDVQHMPLPEKIVSTHAPARGATGMSGRKARIRLVSTHAPARGTTNFCKRLRHFKRVSTHAPARGATGC